MLWLSYRSRSHTSSQGGDAVELHATADMRSVDALHSLVEVPKTLAPAVVLCCADAGCATCGPTIPASPAVIAAMIATYMILFIRTMHSIIYI
jgi:hypothetical protein